MQEMIETSTHTLGSPAFNRSSGAVAGFREDQSFSDLVMAQTRESCQASGHAATTITMHQIVKRVFDVAIELAVGCAVVHAAAILLWFARGKMLFRKLRPGLHGNPFALYKWGSAQESDEVGILGGLLQKFLEGCQSLEANRWSGTPMGGLTRNLMKHLGSGRTQPGSIDR